RHRHGEADQFTRLRIQVSGLVARRGERGVATHGVRRELADLADAALEFAAICVPVEHAESPPGWLKSAAWGRRARRRGPGLVKGSSESKRKTHVAALSRDRSSRID